MFAASILRCRSHFQANAAKGWKLFRFLALVGLALPLVRFQSERHSFHDFFMDRRKVAAAMQDGFNLVKIASNCQDAQRGKQRRRVCAVSSRKDFKKRPPAELGRGRRGALQLGGAGPRLQLEP